MNVTLQVDKVKNKKWDYFFVDYFKIITAQLIFQLSEKAYDQEQGINLRSAGEIIFVASISIYVSSSHSAAQRVP